MLYGNWQTPKLWQNTYGKAHLADYMAATEGFVTEFTLSEMTEAK